jgi:hypothetical protein
MRTTFRVWLERRTNNSKSISSRLSNIDRVEKAYGDLDKHYEASRLEDIISNLQYTKIDKRIGRRNPSKLQIQGDIYDGLATCRSATRLYQKFRDSGDIGIDVSDANGLILASEQNEKRPSQKIDLERDMRVALRCSIEQLEPGLVIVDGGAERFVASGFIDITARDPSGVLVAIEIKTGAAGQRAVAQVLSYMGDLANEEGTGGRVRGILVAADFEKKALAAAKMVPNLLLRRYQVNFQFAEASL